MASGASPSTETGTPRIDLDRARSVAELVSASFEIYARYWRGFLLLAVAVVAPIDLVLFGVVGERLWSSAHPRITAGQEILLVVEPILITLPLVTAVHVRAVQAIGEGRRPPLRRALRQGLSDLPAVSTAVLIAFLATVAGGLALLLPGIWIGVRLAFCAQAVVVDRLRSFTALDRSWNLVRGTWWRTFGVLVLLNAIAGAASTVIASPFDALASAADSGIVSVVAQIVSNTITYSFTALTATLLFFDLRARAAGARPRAGLPLGLEHPERVLPPPA